MKPSLAQLNGIIWAMVVLTTFVFLSRAVVRFRRPHQVAAADYILLLAYIFFMVQAILYLVTISPIYRWQAAFAGETEMYPNFVADLIVMRKVMLINSYVLWCTLWSVKFAFLSLYWKLVQQLPLYIKMWWAVTIFTTLVRHLDQPLRVLLFKLIKRIGVYWQCPSTSGVLSKNGFL